MAQSDTQDRYRSDNWSKSQNHRNKQTTIVRSIQYLSPNAQLNFARHSTKRETIALVTAAWQDTPH